MNVFEFREELVREYEKFSRSFTTIRAADVRVVVDEAYTAERFWPAPLIQLNPNYAEGGSVTDLVNRGLLHQECENIFRQKDREGRHGEVFRLYQHQVEGIEAAKRCESYVLTTGTGSGKSLSYFVPIVDDVLQRGVSGVRIGITAIVVYPMNALCNSQREELEKFLVRGYGSGDSPVSFARYTGQETLEEREAIAANPPDILLTNYVMLELIMTRFMPADMAIRKHAEGLKFLVLDELHTYRGRQGADVAMLVRRVRERFNENLLCIGTSATMASEGSFANRNRKVAEVASRLFGAEVEPDNVIIETLEPVTADSTPIEGRFLRQAIEKGMPAKLGEREFRRHPVAAWVERRLGLEKQNGELTRISRPRSVREASEMLAKETGMSPELCRDYLTGFLLMAFNCRDARGRPLFAFRLHQFISGAWNAYATLEAPGDRYITLDGQRFMPGDRQRSLFALSFCRQCGQEYYPIWATIESKALKAFATRSLFERSTHEEGVQYGYFMPDPANEFKPDGVEAHFPDGWIEYRGGLPRLKYNYRKYQPREVRVDTLGMIAKEGLKGWYIPEAFRFCLQRDCSAEYSARLKETSKLSGLSSEGRSSATTVLALSALKYLAAADLESATKKLLGFSDNRQDAALQAGHFNDFVQVLLLRGALLAAIRHEGSRGITNETLTQLVFEQLRLEPSQYASSPAGKGIRAQNTAQALRDVLGYRLYYDLQRGWRITNPNLEQLELLSIEYQGLGDCCSDEAEWTKVHWTLGALTSGQRFRLVHSLLERMRKKLCIKTIYLDPNRQERIRNNSYNELREPWGLSETERLDPSAFMIPRSKGKLGVKGVYRLLHVSYRSAFARSLSAEVNSADSKRYQPVRLDQDTFNAVIDGILRVLAVYGYVEPEKLSPKLTGYRINSSAIRWCSSNGEVGKKRGFANQFFRDLYLSVAELLQTGYCYLHQMEAREHTAQVDSEEREDREARFRKGLESGGTVARNGLSRGLPILFCSPTMELGVDIALLNTVYMRNVPPTPANYAQRSGRAGRGGQPALVVTYCAAKSPHDQYFFNDPTRMVAGAVSPPAIDLANEDLIRSHLHAVWLAETQVMLGNTVPDVLDREQSDTLPIRTEMSSQLRRPSVVKYAAHRAARIVAMLRQDLGEQAAPWFSDAWLDAAMRSAFRRFDKGFARWRSLLWAATGQMQRSNAVLKNLAASPQQRKEAKARYDQAAKQLDLLLGSQRRRKEGRGRLSSEFYTYRYLASEGFLPGYNFPRLPLLAFIPGRSHRVVGDTFLSRPRFLGLKEYGPHSIIYHEGSTYRVRQAILPLPEDGGGSDPGALLLETTRLCPSCGYGHFQDQRDYERCVSCDALLAAGRSITNLHRIGQVSTRHAMRITSDEEERQRQGYELITTLRYSEERGIPRRKSSTVSYNGKPVWDLQYGPSATIWRINLGWRRRIEKTIYGFSIDAETGEWVKDTQAATDVEDDTVKDGRRVVRITPYVQDTRNVLVIQAREELPVATTVSLQYALKRGIEQVYQLEERELAAEPLHDESARMTILFYEAAEGGAGVLTRLANDPRALSRVAKSALEVCHYKSKSGNWTDVQDLQNQNEDCEAGCYRCLLSYFNQTAHGDIDRRDIVLRDLLCKVANGSLRQIEDQSKSGSDEFQRLLNPTLSQLERDWLNWVRDRGYRVPAQAGVYLQAFQTTPDFAYRDTSAVVFIDGPPHDTAAAKKVDASITRRLEDAGLTVVRFSHDRATWEGIAQEYSWVFGPADCAESD